MSMIDAAAKAGNMRLVRFLHEHGTDRWTSAATDDAAKGGHLDIISFLHENRSEGCTTRTLRELFTALQPKSLKCVPPEATS